MRSFRPQYTLKQTARVEGFGYWSGRDVRVEFSPAPAGSGVVFVRSDGERPRRIAADVNHRLNTPRRTNLASDGVQVEMVEHILAALVGLQIDNCEVWTDAPEMPGCDGSALPFVEALDAAGRVEQNAVRAQLVVDRPIRVGDDSTWVEARPAEGQQFSLNYQLDFGPGPIGRQSFELTVHRGAFRDELAPARTFILEKEAELLREQGLGLRVTTDDLLVFGDDGPLENTLRYDDECVRHKTLDLVGDLALAGCDIIGHVSACRSGHRLNAELVRALLADAQIQSNLRRTA